jgi:hypothetical protein
MSASSSAAASAVRARAASSREMSCCAAIHDSDPAAPARALLACALGRIAANSLCPARAAATSASTCAAS